MEQRGNLEFSEESVLVIPLDEDTNQYLCPFCREELIYVSCTECGVLAEKNENIHADWNVSCEECDDVEKWKRCLKCKINFRR